MRHCRPHDRFLYIPSYLPPASSSTFTLVVKDRHYAREIATPKVRFDCCLSLTVSSFEVLSLPAIRAKGRCHSRSLPLMLIFSERHSSLLFAASSSSLLEPTQAYASLTPPSTCIPLSSPASSPLLVLLLLSPQVRTTTHTASTRRVCHRQTGVSVEAAVLTMCV